MDTFMRVALNVREIVRKDPVLVVAVVLALCSCAAVPPDAAYAEYVDLRTIGMLFSLMTIMCGLSRLGVFRIACRHLLSVVRGPDASRLRSPCSRSSRACSSRTTSPS